MQDERFHEEHTALPHRHDTFASFVAPERCPRMLVGGTADVTAITRHMPVPSDDRDYQRGCDRRSSEGLSRAESRV